MLGFRVFFQSKEFNYVSEIILFSTIYFNSNQWESSTQIITLFSFISITPFR